MRSSEHWHEHDHVAFDIDGTLLNSNIAHTWAWQDALEEQHLFLPYFSIFTQMGLPGKQIVEKFGFAMPDKATAEKVRDRAGEIYTERYVSLVAPFDGTAQLLKKLKAMGKKLHAITSASGEEARAMLTRFKLCDSFELVLTSKDTGQGKPTADPFSALKEKIGTRAKIVSIGDSPFDLKASQASGVPFVYLGHGGFPREWFSGAIAVFFNIKQMLASLAAASPKKQPSKKAA